MDDNKYHEVLEQLKAAFPPNTVQFRNDSGAAYIPNQVYTDRLDRVLQGQWKLEVRELEVNVQGKYVKTIVRVHIGDYFRDGTSIAEITQQGINNAENRAKSAAFVDALDTWEMGWKDLAPHNKDWGKNPGLSHLVSSEAPTEGQRTARNLSAGTTTDHRCIFSGCGQHLSQAEFQALKLIPNYNRQKMVYCSVHLPDHFLLKIPEEAVNQLPEEMYQRWSKVREEKTKK